jgi:hypothetical protein
VSPFNDRPPPERELFYLIDADYTLSRQKLTLEVARRERKTNGEWGKLKSQRLYSREVDALTDPVDRRIAAMLFGARQELGYTYSSYYDSAPSLFAVPGESRDLALPLIADRTVFVAQSKLDGDRRLVGRRLAELCLRSARTDGGATARRITARSGELDLSQPLLLLASGLVFDGRIARSNDCSAFAWVAVYAGRRLSPLKTAKFS